MLVGFGARTVGQLEAGGDAFPNGRAPNQICTGIDSIPCFENDGRTQLGTGFDEVTADGRVVFQWPKPALLLRHMSIVNTTLLGPTSVPRLKRPR